MCAYGLYVRCGGEKRQCRGTLGWKPRPERGENCDHRSVREGVKAVAMCGVQQGSYVRACDVRY